MKTFTEEESYFLAMRDKNNEPSLQRAVFFLFHVRVWPSTYFFWTTKRPCLERTLPQPPLQYLSKSTSLAVVSWRGRIPPDAGMACPLWAMGNGVQRNGQNMFLATWLQLASNSWNISPFAVLSGHLMLTECHYGCGEARGIGKYLLLEGAWTLS